MEPNVDLVNIVQIRELATAAGVDLSWLLPTAHPTTGGSKKMTLQTAATIISEQIGSVTIPANKYYRVDGPLITDPDADGNTVTDTSLDGLDYNLEKWGVGNIRKGIEWQNDVSGGGWRLLDATFVSGEMYVAVPKPLVSNILSAPDAVARFANGITIKTADTTIGTSDFRKIIVVQGAKVITLPLCSAYPAYVALFIVTSEGSQKQCTITCQSPNTTTGVNTINSYTDNNLVSLYLGQREFVTLITDGTKWYIQSVSPAVFQQPTMSMSWLNNSFNTIPAAGGLYNRADYARVVNFLTLLQAQVPGSVLTEAAWAANKTMWGMGNGTTTFRAPDMRGYFPRWLSLGQMTDTDRVSSGLSYIPGSAQSDQLRAHTHTWTAQDSNDSLGGTGYVGTVNNSIGPGYTALHTLISTVGGTETRSLNAGFYPLINI